MKIALISGIALSLLSGLTSAGAPASVFSCQSLVPSAYGPAVWPGSEASRPVPANIIANWGYGYGGAGGGPGMLTNAANLVTVKKAQAAHIQVLGYVWTDYANNAAGNPVQPWMTPAPLAAVEKEALEWYSWYHVTDLFFDGATTGTAKGQLTYYLDLYQYVHQHIPGAQVWINPGWYPASSAYMSAADVLMDFEGSYSTLTTNPPPAWVRSYPASRFASALQLPDSQSASLGAALALTRADNVGHVYVAEQPDYSRLPSYWNAENAAVTACG